MTEELQTAYNEWLLKYGFREVIFKELSGTNGYSFVYSLSYKIFCSIIKRRADANPVVTYQLKTPEELQNENPTKTP